MIRLAFESAVRSVTQRKPHVRRTSSCDTWRIA